jgi:cysteine desulfurase/selenocysteine lyase
MVYFDNAATSKHKPLSVKIALIKGITTYSANPGRAGHFASIKAGEKVFHVRQQVKEFFHAPNGSHVIFTSGCTEALNLALLGTKQENKHIIITTNEHNSVIRPVHHLHKTYNISYTIVTPDKLGRITPEDILAKILPNTYLIAVNHTSNVTGATSDIKRIGEIAKRKNILFLVDAAQSAGHEVVNMSDQNINLLAIAGHKGLLAPQGVGCLVVTKNVKLQPVKFGGTGTFSESINQPTEAPEGFESGTIATPNIVALGAGIAYVEKNFNKMNNKITQLTTYLLNELKKIPLVKLYSNNPKSGVVSFEIINIDTNELTNILNEKFKICVRGGLHCAPLIHKHLHNNYGLVRVSLSHKNSKCQIKKLIHAINFVIETFHGK